MKTKSAQPVKLIGLISVALFIFLTACSPALPTLDVDEAHFTAFKHGEFEDAYRLAPGPGFNLDATGYPFLVPAEAPPEVNGPNMIQLSTNDGQVYTHPWDLQYTLYALTPDTLTNAAAGGPPFPGLQAGQRYVLGIGYQDDQGRFIVLWASILDVRAP